MFLSAGIDFGTTNSSAAVSDGATVKMAPLEDGSATIPTAMYFPEDKSRIYFGREALRQYTEGGGEGRLMRSIKRILGTDLMRRTTMIGGRSVSYDAIVASFIDHLKNKMIESAGDDIDNVVMGRPVHFRDDDPEGDRRAEDELGEIAKAAGFKNVAFQFEPIAAAFAHERNISGEKLAIVMDIGGGTSDFPIIRLSPERKNLPDRSADVLANTGVRVGGNDFDRALSLKSFMPAFGMNTEIGGSVRQSKILPMPSAPYFSLSTWSDINDLYAYQSVNKIREYFRLSRSPDRVRRLVEIVERNLGHKNLAHVEDAKIKLSSEDEIKIVLDFLSDRPAVSSTRTDFVESIGRDMSAIKRSVEECLSQSGVKAESINLVILTGGSTEIPHINEVAREYFPNAELSAEDKMSSVGLGLAYDSMRRF
jgi:hypothetical chaperone protein